MGSHSIATRLRKVSLQDRPAAASVYAWAQRLSEMRAISTTAYSPVDVLAVIHKDRTDHLHSI